MERKILHIWIVYSKNPTISIRFMEYGILNEILMQNKNDRSRYHNQLVRPHLYKQEKNVHCPMQMNLVPLIGN